MSIGNLPEVVSREAWLAARKELLAEEKELTRHRDQVNAARRRLPMASGTFGSCTPAMPRWWR